MRMIRLLDPIQRRVRKTLSSETVVVLYHRVGGAGPDPLLLSVSPSNFADQLEALRSRGPVMPLREMVDRILTGKRIPPRSAAITFDDGYADNLEIAHPLIARAGLHATYFLASGMIGSEHGFWWDELSLLLLTPRSEVRSLQIELGGHRLTWSLPGATTSMNEARGWNILSQSDPTDAQRAYRAIFESMRVSTQSYREDLLADMREQLGDSKFLETEDRALTWEAVQRLSSQPEAEIGAHTVTHPVLGTLSDKEEMWEISHGKRMLEEKLDNRVDAFAYPYGSKSDYRARTVVNVKRAGFSFACSNFERPITGRQDPHQIPRFLARDWNGEELLHHLDSAFI